MLNFVNKSKEPVLKEEIKNFGFSDKEIEEFTSRIKHGGGVGSSGNIQHITSTPILIKPEQKKEEFRLTTEGYKLLQDHWHTQASKRSTWVMAALTLVGLYLSWILVSSQNVQPEYILVNVNNLTNIGTYVSPPT